LTERQALYLRLVEEEGMSHAEVALFCGVSKGTVSSTISFIRNRQLSVAGELELTTRQLEILVLVGAGMTDPQIGSELYLSRKTVEHRISDARERLGARNRFHCVVLAIARELLILDHDGALRVPHTNRVAA
jgi:DNA-binding NarL/FixJ family response regulator